MSSRIQLFLIGASLHHMVGPFPSCAAKGAVNGTLPTTGLKTATCQTLAGSYTQVTWTAAAFKMAF